MMSSKRTILTLTSLALLLPGLAGVGRAQASVTDDSPKTLTISDAISFTSGRTKEPIAGVQVTAEPGGQSVVTDAQGRYAIKVPYGWTGRLVYSKKDFVFDPNYKPFTNVTADVVGEGLARLGGQSGSPSVPTAGYPTAVLPVPADKVFVIPMADVVPQQFAETAEDLRVMLQILREKVTQPRQGRGMFMDFGNFFDDRSRACEALHLQGSAAVFVLEMDLPLSLPPSQPDANEAAQEPVDPVWQRVRQNLYTPNRTLPGASGQPDETQRLDFRQFQEDLLQTLRHAANLRHVEPNEAVIVTVIAHDESGGGSVSTGGFFSNAGGMWFEGGSYSTSSASFGPGGGNTQADSRTYSRGPNSGPARVGRTPAGSGPARPTMVLTIRAKKADIDAFANGGLSFEQFRQRAKTFTY